MAVRAKRQGDGSSLRRLVYCRASHGVGRSRYAAQARCPFPRCNSHCHMVNPVGLIVRYIPSKEHPYDPIDPCQRIASHSWRAVNLDLYGYKF